MSGSTRGVAWACLLAASLPVSVTAQGRWHVIEGMERVRAQQSTEVWCWAAALAIAARASRVPLTQEEVVVDAKGRIAFETASYEEITAYLKRGWRGAPGNPSTWTVDTIDFKGPAPAEMFLRYFQIGRPIIVGYDTASGTGHAVIAYGGEFVEEPGRPSRVAMKTVRLYDPLDGRSSDEDWSMFEQTVTGTWLPTIVRRDGCNVFGPNGVPPGCEPPVRGSGAPAPALAQNTSLSGTWCTATKDACLTIQSLDRLLFHYTLNGTRYIGYSSTSNPRVQSAGSTDMQAVNPATDRTEGPAGRIDVSLAPDGNSLSVTFSFPGLRADLTTRGPLHLVARPRRK